MLNKIDYSKKQIIDMLSLKNSDELNDLYEKAYQIKLDNIGGLVYFRGIIELGNVCEKDCYYCGIRKSNNKVNRFVFDKETIIECAKWCYTQNYGSIVLQSGESKDKNYVNYITELLKEIKKIGNGELGITLSLGEQDEDTYKAWYNAGAHRYLLRVETTNNSLFRSLHPKSHSLEERIKCLDILGKLGYQVGTGVMIGFPGQTVEDLANDIIFFKEKDIDMIGMGPYVRHSDTPFGQYLDNSDEVKKERLELGLKMIAVARIVLQDVNIATSTALQALHPLGRERGLKAGANIIMPVITPKIHRKDYMLYEDKPCMEDDAEDSKINIIKMVENIGEKVVLGKWGDSKHFSIRKNIK
ncbi:MAG: [FeFe] hydrogenase H-cluster radical SAM maturase HydE [Fusobacteria bacterium]|nr:[FeFe] hydrogenase H-cluster radical SAM maturase HydE [Fusobacteriota bacterium]